MILLDFVGERGLRIPREALLRTGGCGKAAGRGPAGGGGPVFPAGHGAAVLDDHMPFIREGVPSVDLIDFDFPCFHRRCDDLSRISAAQPRRRGRNRAASCSLHSERDALGTRQSCCSRPPAATARGSTGPCRRWSAPSSSTARPCTSARRSCTTSTSSSSCASGVRSSSSSETEVPEGETVVFSAHGVAPSVHANAGDARAEDDRRHLPAGDQGARGGQEVRRRRPHDRADRPRGPRGGGGHHGRGARRTSS